MFEVFKKSDYYEHLCEKSSAAVNVRVPINQGLEPLMGTWAEIYNHMIMMRELYG